MEDTDTDRVITWIEQVTPSWLTEVLRQRGVLPRGRVLTVERSATRAAFDATMCSLVVTYSPDSSASAPSRLILKVARSDQPPSARPTSFGAKEVAFYARIAPQMPGGPVPRCFDAACAKDGARWHLLLEDVSATHEQPPYPLPPSEAHCALAVEALARLHAAWWDHPRLGVTLGGMPSEEGIRGQVERTERTVTAFLTFLGDRLSPARRRVYDLLLASQHQLRRRQLERPPTLVHGDSHWGNFLYPRSAVAHTEPASHEMRPSGVEATEEQALLIDWQMWGVAAGTSDLAHAIANAWFPERRQRLERSLLEHYHQALCANGVRGYSWDACWTDYRLFVTTTPFTPAFQWQRQGTPLVWWPNLERGMLAFEDLGCEEFTRA